MFASPCLLFFTNINASARAARALNSYTKVLRKPLGFEQEVPDHSTFSKNRYGRFRQSGVFREVFEEIVRRCLQAGLVEGRNLAVSTVEGPARPLRSGYIASLLGTLAVKHFPRFPLKLPASGRIRKWSRP
jgi:hypothetical protein